MDIESCDKDIQWLQELRITWQKKKWSQLYCEKYSKEAKAFKARVLNLWVVTL